MASASASASTGPDKGTASTSARPTASRVSSFSVQSDRADHDAAKPARRAQTFQATSPSGKENASSSAFDVSESPDNDDGIEIEVTRASIELDVLPIELVTLTDSFIDSLGAKVHSTPPNIEKLSQLFQDFYAQASSHINTHINALATRRSRDASPAASASSISSAASRLRNKASNLNASKDKPRADSEQQMITTEELADRKKARKGLEVKRHLLEEAVERRLCEGIYDRIYQHKSTQDEAQDDKLRSKTAALALVGIGPADLGIELGEGTADTPETTATKTTEIKERLASARRDLLRMHESKYPLGKLNHLKAAHRSIVDTIAHFHPSASADEIMPMLIYTLITLPPEHLHVISDINFIQRFRWEPKLTGEAAYCLTNLEATISFLQTVDLATLRSDELPSGPPKGTPGTPKTETFPPAYPQGLTVVTNSLPETTKANATASKPPVSPGGKSPLVRRNRRLSDLVNTPAQAFGAASDAVFNTADQGLKTVTNSLDNSYKFLLGKLRERQDGPEESIAVPRTLDDARKLVSTPPPDEANLGGISPISEVEDAEQSKRPSSREDRMLNLIGGRRDHSTDSAVSGRSTSSSKFKAPGPPTPTPPTNSTPPMLDQMRNLSNTFNPMARLSNQIGMIRGFGRNAAATPPAQEVGKTADGGDLGTAFPDIAAALPPKKEFPKIPPPNKRFMELQNPGDLKLNEVLELLRDYRRLAGSLQKMGAFEEK